MATSGGDSGRRGGGLGPLSDRSGPSADGRSGLLARIGFDARLERDALRKIAELDIESARIAYATLADRLDLDATAGSDRAVSLLLLDTLLRVNRRVHRDTTDEAASLEHRVDLIERFASLDNAEHARRAFMPALNVLLAPLQPDAHPRSSLVERAKTFIEESYHRRISLSSVADHLHVSPSYLSRQFRKETGQRLTAYVQRIRLDHARLLLAEGERSISEIAYLVGYQNYRDFYRNFVKYERASPRQAQRKFAPGTP